MTTAATATANDPVRLYCDEDVDRRLAGALRQRGFDVETTVEAGLRNASDHAQMHHALTQRRALVRHNIRHFPGLHAEWIAANQEHWGVVILVGQGAIGAWLRRMEQVRRRYSAQELRNQLLFVSANSPEPG